MVNKKLNRFLFFGIAFFIPLLKTFQVDPQTIDFLNQKRQQYFENHPTKPAENIVYMSDTGRFSGNLASWEDKEYQQFVHEELVNSISILINLPKEKIDLHNNFVTFLHRLTHLLFEYTLLFRALRNLLYQ